MSAASAGRGRRPAGMTDPFFLAPPLTAGNSLFCRSAVCEDHHRLPGRNADAKDTVSGLACKRLGLFRGERDGRNVRSRPISRQRRRELLFFERIESHASGIERAEGRKTSPRIRICGRWQGVFSASRDLRCVGSLPPGRDTRCLCRDTASPKGARSAESDR